MHLADYQIAASGTDLGTCIGDTYWVYPMMGLAGEAGELMNKVKKVFRDEGGDMSIETLEKFKGELGDVLWYLAVASHRLGLTLEEIAASNLAKLAGRKEKGTLRGSGDNR